MPLSVEDVARIKESMKVGEGEQPLEFFKETPGKLRLRQGMKGSHWTKVRETLPNHIQQCIPCETDSEDGSSASNRSGEDDVQEEPSAGEPDEAPSAAGHAASQTLAGRSNYVRWSLTDPRS